MIYADKQSQCPMRQTLTPALARVFKRLHYPFDVVLMCVRWYVAYGLSAPSVLVNRYLDGSHPHVVLDDVRGITAIINHLIELGHKRIAFWGGLRRYLGTRRLAGYKAALKEAGLPFDPSLAIDTGYDREGGERGASTLLSLANRPTAIFATNRLVAAGAMHEAHRQGFNVPKDLSVASFYDGPVAELLNPAVTSVLYPPDRLGYELVAMLVDILAGVAPATTNVIIPHDKIVVRSSTGRAPMKMSRRAY